jgi:hypothetical protein
VWKVETLECIWNVLAHSHMKIRRHLVGKCTQYPGMTSCEEADCGFKTDGVKLLQDVTILWLPISLVVLPLLLLVCQTISSQFSGAM